MNSLRDTINVAKALIIKKDYREAEAILSELLESNPTNALVLGHLADLYIKMGRLDDAERNVELILSRQPSNLYALQKKGDILVKRGRFNEALEILLDIYKGNDSDYFLTKRISKTYLLMDNPTKALEYANVAKNNFSAKADVYFLIFQIYRKLGDQRSAEQAINKALEVDPRNKFFYSQKISLRLQEKNLDSSNVQEILDLTDDNNSYMVRLMADRLKKEGKFDKAVEVYKRLISIDGNEFNQKGLGYLYYKMKEYGKAFKIFMSLSDPNFTDNIFLSTIIASARELDDKKQLIERMVQLADGSDQYKSLWGRIKKLGKAIEDEENTRSCKYS